MNKRRFTILVLCTILVSSTLLFILPNLDNSNNQITSNHYEEREDDELKRVNHQERMKHELKMLQNPKTGKIPKGVQLKSINAAMDVSSYCLPYNDLRKTLPTITVTERGPNNYGGRTRALAFDTRSSSIVLAGGVTSGILRSDDGGATWTKVTPTGAIHSVTCFAQDTRNGQENTWYAGTGEVGSSADATGGSYYGYGIYKSTDNGLTWTALAATQGGDLENFDDAFDYVSRIVVNPTNGHVLAIASNSVSRSTNGGTSWTSELGSSSNSRWGDIIYNSVGGKFYAALHCDDDTNGGVWESSDGDTWTRIRTEAQLNASIDIGRIILSNVANTKEIVVMFEMLSDFTCSNSNKTKAGLMHFDGTSTWTDHTDYVGNCTQKYTAANTLPTQLKLQEGYNMALTTKPDDANVVFIGGVEAYRYNLDNDDYEFIGGSQASANTVNLHVDQHIFVFEPSSNVNMWVGNDGGVRKADVTTTIKANANDDDNGYTWTSRNSGYNGYQFYGVDIDPSNGSNFVAGGAQDNAFTIHPTSAEALEVGPTADGVDIAVISGGSDFNTHNIFQMSQEGDLQRFENGSAATGSINPAATQFAGHFYLDADNTNYMYFPSASPSDNPTSFNLYRTRIAESINSSSVTGSSTTGWESMTGVNGLVSTPISAMDASRDIQYGGDYSASSSDRKLYIGTEGGKVFRLNDPAFVSAATAAVEITPTGMAGNGYVSDIAVNPVDDKEILVTYSNYGVSSVWHTSDASVVSPTWTNVEGASGSSVELASARCALITRNDGNLIYMVGTSTGLYATDALSGATTSWTRIGSSTIGLAICVEMRLRTSDNKVALGTHGNGMFLLSFPGSLPVELTSFDGQVINESQVQLDWITASELHNRGFEIERSRDGEAFETIGFVEGNGTTSDVSEYRFIDKNAKSGAWYYRLKQLDTDDNFEYSKVVYVDLMTADLDRLSLYPNPATTELNIQGGKGMVSIYSLNGQLVREIDNTQSIKTISTQDLPDGIYILRLTRNDNSVETQRFIKQ